MCSSSELSISSSIPVIFPARFECIVWMSGNRRSSSICFCSWGGGRGVLWPAWKRSAAPAPERGPLARVPAGAGWQGEDCRCWRHICKVQQSKEQWQQQRYETLSSARGLGTPPDWQLSVSPCWAVAAPPKSIAKQSGHSDPTL